MSNKRAGKPPRTELIRVETSHQEAEQDVVMGVASGTKVRVITSICPQPRHQKGTKERWKKATFVTSGAHTALLGEPRTNSDAKGGARSSSLGYKLLPGGSGQTPGGALCQTAAGETMTSSREVHTPRGAGVTSVGWGGLQSLVGAL